MAIPPREQLETAKIIAGPFSLYSNSFEVEFLEPPPTLHATVLMKATYIYGPKSLLGKSHGQSPPLHLHFAQSESFFVSSGLLGTTTTWDNVDKAFTPADGVQEFPPWMPHRFWPHPEAKEDTTIYVWAHPDQVQQPMDWLFFLNLLRYISDVDEGKAKLDPFYIMTVQHASATALVWFPRQKWLGPLRWWVPWKIQGGFAAVGKMFGYKALLEKYTPKEEWENYLRAKRA
ncbi:hypothetical protein BDV96DRAFT_28095 [Lophiotrema nucula]|uniref:Cupin 2 conserved barrel domain-containing protein n=1 Tax=Lophiotrema nucula TaxID=690887 RepID=A0A6A5ZDV5_9PLEO|nr:hypothetical protein BDV96DRAFT_28095 [Lophiotrema nucula]